MPARTREAASSESRDVSAEVGRGARSTRNKRQNYVVESSSSEEEEEEEEEFDEEQEEFSDEEEVAPPVATTRRTRNEEVGGEDTEEVSEDEDAEGEVDADGDIEMDEDADDGLPLGHRAAPTILRVNGPAPPKPTVTVTPAKDTKIKSVEAKEMEMADDDDDDDEELSELESNEEEEVEEAEEEDAEGEEEEEEEDAEGDEDEEDAEGMDTGADGPTSMAEEEDDDDGSRASTPDISKMTKRQRSRLERTTETGGDFLQLPMEPQIKKLLTAEEQNMRRAEMARRRKNLSEKRNEEEKMDTINRLLKKQAPKRRGKISAAEIQAQDRADSPSPVVEQEDEEVEVAPADPVYVRWVNNAQGSRIGVPGEWLGTPVGNVFGEAPAGSGKMVTEVEG